MHTHTQGIVVLPAGLWRGSAVTLVRDWPSFGVYFAVYEGMQEVLSPGSRQSHVIHPLALLMAGEYTLNPQIHPLALLMACKHAHNHKCSLITHAVPLADTLICRSDSGLFHSYIHESQYCCIVAAQKAASHAKALHGLRHKLADCLVRCDAQ